MKPAQAALGIALMLLAGCGDEPTRGPYVPAPVLAGREFICLVGADRVERVVPHHAPSGSFPVLWRVTIRFQADGSFRYEWRRPSGQAEEGGTLTGSWRSSSDWEYRDKRSWGDATVRIWHLAEGAAEPPGPTPTGVASVVPWPNVMCMKLHGHWALPAVDFETGQFIDHQHWHVAFLETPLGP